MRSGLAILAAIALASLLVGWLGPDPARQTLARSLEAPGREHAFGTDLVGRDLLARVLAGTRISLEIGVAATAVSVLLGIAVGALAGYFGGALDAVLMRAVDVLYGLPFVAFVVVLVLVFGRGVVNLFVAIGAVSWLTTARIVRAEVRSLRAREFVLAARALGASHARVIAVHILPNLLGTVVIYAALTVPIAIREEALLSFLGLGVEPPAASLGSLVREGLGVLSPGRFEWWLLAFPGAALVLVVAALNRLADGLRDRLDPRSGGGPP
ncbi:MAG TPA: ABC transporter permease [Planctomycetota bacterium]|nr:ABC transporter permease [Planctomycetota bacterium]